MVARELSYLFTKTDGSPEGVCTVMNIYTLPLFSGIFTIGLG